MVFLEAQAMRLPVVSFRNGGIPEAVEDGATGFLLPDRDCEGLARSIALLFDDGLLLSRMSLAARERVRTKFELGRQCLALEEIYRQVLEGRLVPRGRGMV